jgi:hypothetical protein
MNQKQNLTCTLEILSNGEFNCQQECKLRTISGLPGNGEKFTGPACEVLAQDLESIRISLVDLTDEQLVEVINYPEANPDNAYSLRLGYWEFQNDPEE